MGKNKKMKFAQNETFENMVQPKRIDLLEKRFSLKGNWNKHFFKNKNPIIIELGCGPSFLKEVYPNTIYTDIDKHENCDLVVNATDMPFENESINFLVDRMSGDRNNLNN